MIQIRVVAMLLGLAFQGSDQPKTMLEMRVRLSGPGVRGATATRPKVIYRAGTKYARMEDSPNRAIIIAEPDAYSVDHATKTGTHAIDQGGPDDMHLPMVLPFDPNHKLGILDRLEFGQELAFFQKAEAAKEDGPLANGKKTDLYKLEVSGSKAELLTYEGASVPVYVSWTTNAGTYKYVYQSYEDVAFDARVFARPTGVKMREIPPLAPNEEK